MLPQYWLAIPIVYLVLSLVAYAVYAADKRAAVARRWRTPESTLILLGFAGGWPGALVAQRRLRHKTRKTRFLVVFWFSVAANLVALAAIVVFVSSNG